MNGSELAVMLGMFAFGASDKIDGTDPYVAVGVKYLANNNLSVGVFYNWYRMDDQDVTVRAKSVDLRVGYSF